MPKIRDAISMTVTGRWDNPRLGKYSLVSWFHPAQTNSVQLCSIPFNLVIHFHKCLWHNIYLLGTGWAPQKCRNGAWLRWSCTRVFFFTPLCMLKVRFLNHITVCLCHLALDWEFYILDSLLSPPELQAQVRLAPGHSVQLAASWWVMVPLCLLSA